MIIESRVDDVFKNFGYIIKIGDWTIAREVFVR